MMSPFVNMDQSSLDQINCWSFRGTYMNSVVFIVFTLFSHSQKQDYFAEPLEVGSIPWLDDSHWNPPRHTLFVERDYGPVFKEPFFSSWEIPENTRSVSTAPFGSFWHETPPRITCKRGKMLKTSHGIMIALVFCVIWTSWAASEWTLALSADRLVRYFFCHFKGAFKPFVSVGMGGSSEKHQNMFNNFFPHGNVFCQIRLP